MRDYQRTKNNPYQLPNPIYHQTLWFIRSYDSMHENLADKLLSTQDHDNLGVQHSRSITSEQERKAEKRENTLHKVTIIEECLDMIPEEYRRAVWRNIQYRESYPLYADRRTYGRWKTRYIYYVAVRSGIYDSENG